MADTTTQLNPSTGGDVMDETVAYQADGVTQGKRPRVNLGMEMDPQVPALSLVAPKHPLPIEDVVSIQLLREIRDAVVDLRKVFAKLYNV